MTTIKLDLNEISHRRVAEVLRAAGLHLIADQYEDQLPKPIQPEPAGDVVVLDRDGVRWFPHADSDMGGLYWSAAESFDRWKWNRPALHERYGTFRIYRAEPSLGAIEALVQDLAQQIMNGGPWVSQIAIANNVRGFARRLLGGDQ